MNDVYYNPADHGLEIVGEFDWDEPCYSFDICVVWKERRGVYWVGNDSGCSCPSPFEYITDKNELDGPYNKTGLKRRLEGLVEERADDSYGYSKATLMKSVREILSRIN